MQPFTQELSRTRLTECPTDIAIGPAKYHADIGKGVVIERGADRDQAHPIAHAMGGKNVFYFLTPLERGRLQVLPLAYDLQRQEWFDMAASAVRHLAAHPDAPLDWRESPFTFNTACFSCHVSQLSKNYDLKTDSYHTTWAEPGINCETCHGPAAEHVRVARALPKGQPLTDPKLIVTSNFTAPQMNSLCASCHAKMVPLTSSFSPGEPFHDHFGLLGLEHPDFYPDGRDLGENFTETTWRLSPCVKSEKLDCTHCHTSSGRYRFEGGKANNACLPCHLEKVENPALHTRHPAGTDGSKCISCHMPMTEFARMRRSDHSMRPPMPAASLAHGSPNACNLCHQDQDAAWADHWVRQWHPRDYQAPLLDRAALIAAARRQDWSALPAMVNYLAGAEREEIWAASLIQLLRACPDERKWPGIKACLTDGSPLVRAAAVDAWGDSLRADRIRPLLIAARDAIRLVRVRAAAALAPWPAERVPAQDRAALAQATEEYRHSLLARPDDSSSQYNLGNFHVERREFSLAIAAFQQSSRLQPQSIPPLVNASLAYNALGQNQQAEASLRQALRLDPTNAIAHLNLGMLLAEVGKLNEAEQAFRNTFKSDPQSAAAAYNLGVLLAADRPQEALIWCRRAATLRPDEPKYAYTLAYFLTQTGQSAEAIQVLENAIATTPGYPDFYALLGQLFEQQRNFAQALALYRRAAASEHLPAPIRQQFAARAQMLLRQ